MTHRAPTARTFLLALLLLAATLLAPGPATAQAPPGAAAGTNGPIAFVVNSDIWYRDAQGAFHQVTFGQLRPNWDLEVSPDGRRIAFSIASTAGLWVVNLNGTGLRNVLAGYEEISGNSGYDPSWDPSGERLVFTGFSMKTGNHELFTVAVDDATSLERLTSFGVGSGASPVWNPVPGSTEVAFIPCCTGRIKTIDAVTRQETWVTAEDDPPAWSLDWSPDGQRLAVEAYSDGRLYTVDRDGTNWVYLDPGYSKALKEPSWSPDGSMLAVEGLDPNGSTAVLLVDPDVGVPGGVTAVTGDWGSTEFAPSWGPACETACTGTELTARAKKLKDSRLKVSGALRPDVTGVEVTVSLHQKTKKGWREVAARTVRTQATGAYAATLRRPGRGKCGVVVEFTGNATFMASHTASLPFRC